MQSSFLIGGDDLLISPPQIKSDLRALKPFLHSLFSFHVRYVILEGLLLDAKGFKNAEHLMHCVVSFAKPIGLNTTIGADAFGGVDARHLINLSLLSFFHHGLSHDKLLKHSLLGVLSPSVPGFPQISILEG